MSCASDHDIARYSKSLTARVGSSPGALLLLTSWYSKSELPPRIAILYAGNTLSNCFGGLIAAGVLSGMEDVLGMRAWRWLFLVSESYVQKCEAIPPGLTRMMAIL